MTTLTTTAVRFVTPLAGLGDATDWELTEVSGGLYKLTSPGLRLFVVDPALYAPAYAPRVPAVDLTRIGLDDDGQPTVLLVANLTGGQVTLNEFAPLLINPHTGAAIQSITG